MPPAIAIPRSIQAALSSNRPVVALESSVLSQGLPIPHNRTAAELMSRAVRDAGAVPAITAVVRGQPTLGLEGDDLERFLRRDGIRKVSARDVAPAMVAGADGATTVAATLAIASRAGVEVFATGGIGGVHRRLPGAQSSVVDESADLLELADTPIVVVCAGAKSILDLAATWERLETLGVAVVGYCTDALPGFFTADVGIRLHTRADSPDEIAAIFRAGVAFGRRQALLVVQPPPAEHALAHDDVERATAAALDAAARSGISGAAVTPYLLDAVTRLTGGRSLEANISLLECNAKLAARIAVSLCGRAPDSS